MEQADRDMLIRIDERTMNTDKQVEHIKEWIEAAPCQMQKEKIKFIERIAWGATLTAIAATVKTFWK